MAKRISELRHNLEEDLPATQFVGGFPRKFVSVVASAPGTGKTWFVLRMCMDLSTGGSVFFGFAYHQPITKSIIMCGEGGLEMLVERVKAMNMYYDPSQIAIYTAADLAAEKIEICLDEHEGLVNLRKIIAGEKADIVFIDTLIAFRSDDENAGKETARLLSRLAGIANKLNCAIVLTHHTRKKKRKDTGEITQDDIIGSSAITRLCATAWLLSKEKDDSRLLRCVKSWWRTPRAIAWKICSVPGQDVTLKRTNQLEGFYAHEAVRDYILTAPKMQEILVSTIAEETFCNPIVVNAEVETCAEQGLIQLYKRDDGNYAIMNTKA